MYEKVARGDLNSCKDSRAKRSARIDAIKPIDDEDYDTFEGSGVANKDDNEYDGDKNYDNNDNEYEGDKNYDDDDDDYETGGVDGIWDDENLVICDNIERKNHFRDASEFYLTL